MPVDYSIDESKALLVTTASGVVNDADIVSYLERLLGDPRYRSGMDGLVFTDQIEVFEVTASGIAQAAEIGIRSEERFAGSRWAIVARQDAVFGMTRMWDLRRVPESHEVRVFREAGPAIEWLESRASETRDPAKPPA